MITGANRGGKSTFLRSIGLSVLMLQCGMFVPAKAYTASICIELFTHFKKEEDSSLQSGKLEEELRRMDKIVQRITSSYMFLLNESFAATNEREGSKIARQIITALIEKIIRIFYFTHLYTFAKGMFAKRSANCQFLQAERQSDENRTFILKEGTPLQTSFAEDLYRKIFKTE